MPNLGHAQSRSNEMKVESESHGYMQKVKEKLEFSKAHNFLIYYRMETSLVSLESLENEQHD